MDDEKATTAIGFLRRAIAHYNAYGVTVQQLMTDNGSAYRSTVHAIACRALGIRHLRTRPYRPQTNGKAERFIRTMLGGWAYGAIYRNSTERTAALDAAHTRGSLRRQVPGDRLGAIGDAEGAQDLSDVPLDGGLGEEDPLADLGVAEAPRHEGEDLNLARRERPLELVPVLDCRRE